MLSDKTLTVFTPTFNRAHTLPRLYDSLCHQTCKDFEWLVIDDGSTDDTGTLINEFISENIIPIRYIYQENGGLHTGYNTAYANISTELNVCIDSDDYMPDDAVEIILNTWKERGSDKYAGITGLDFYAGTDKPIAGYFPENMKEAYLLDLYIKLIHRGDSKQVLRTDLMKKIAPMVGFKGEKFFNPFYMIYKVCDTKPMLIVNKNLCFVDYQDNDSMSKAIWRQYLDSPRSFAKLRISEMQLKRSTFLNNIRLSIHYTSSCLLSKDRNWLKNSPEKILTLFTSPIGYFLYLTILFKNRGANPKIDRNLNAQKKLKILHIITSLRTGGAERMLSELIPLINKNSIKTDILIFDGSETSFLRNLTNNGILIHSNKRGRWNMWNPLNILTIRKVLKNNDYDIIHTHNTPAQFLAAIALFDKNIFMVTTEHNTTNKRRKYCLLKRFDSFIYKAYDHIVCVSNKTRDNLIGDINLETENVSVIPNGINLSTFSPNSSKQTSEPIPPINPGDKIILMTGAFRKQKDQPTLIRAMQHLPDNFKLWFAGGWELKKKAERLSKRLGLNNRIYFLGIRDDIPALMQLADINVLSSHYEGMPLAAIESMASGKPFIASDVPGIRDIADGAAVLVPEGDDKALADAIYRISVDQSLANEIAAKCMERASHFDINNTLNAHLNLYKNICK